MDVKSKRKYEHVYKVASNKRMAKCGHVSYEGRYYECEKCRKNLREDTGDWTYFGEKYEVKEEELEEEQSLENNCE